MTKRERGAAVWSDADDDTTSKPMRVSARSTPDWATKRDDDEIDGSDSEFESFLASTSVANALKRFKHEGLRMRRRADLNIDARATSGPVHSMSWQRLGKDSMSMEPLVAFATRSDKEVRLCRISENGKRSTIEYSLDLKKRVAPRVIQFISEEELLVAGDHNGGRTLIYNIANESHQEFSGLGGRRIDKPRFIATSPTEHPSVFSLAYDEGHIVTLDRRSRQLVSEHRLNNSCVGLNWDADGRLFCGDARANIYQFDARKDDKCVSRNQLDTITNMSSFTMNSTGLIACGSPFGTVDIIDADSLSGTQVSPSVLFSFDRLTTGVTGQLFHPTVPSLLLAYSGDKRNALKVYECQTGRTLPGWPTEKEPIGRAKSAGFSDCGRFLSVGCKSGRVQMYAIEQ